MKQNKRFRATYIIDIFIEDDFMENDLTYEENQDQLIKKANIKSEEIKRTINNALNGCNIQLNNVEENEFGKLL